VRHPGHQLPPGALQGPFPGPGRVQRHRHLVELPAQAGQLQGGHGRLTGPVAARAVGRSDAPGLLHQRLAGRLHPPAEQHGRAAADEGGGGENDPQHLEVVVGLEHGVADGPGARRHRHHSGEGHRGGLHPEPAVPEQVEGDQPDDPGRPAGEQGGDGQLPGVARGHRHGPGQQEDGEPARQGDGDSGREVAAESGVALFAHGSNR
jgi:hypothetical protein